MGIHIGQIIRKAVKSKNLTVTEFANRIHYTRGNAYKIFEKESLDTELLEKISDVLGQNLFFNFIKESELEERFNDKLKSMLAMKAWDDFMAQVKKDGESKQKRSPVKTTTKKPVKKAKK